ncbi:methyltransferase domain-containing protein [Lysobacter koreensis]|uniref:Methyltransferase domain-containing protein n=1 Tax=Lysobacter koreensis TaxID=266122 RepID=A0ABW2YVI4_9GAMM
MYTESLGKDAVRFTKAVATNQLARFAPKLYLNLSHETGRGEEDSSDASQNAEYFRRCFDDYRHRLGFDVAQFEAFLRGKAVLEYGPGDVLGVALLLYAHGADYVHCVDRFAREKATAKNIQTYKELLDGLEPAQRKRADGAFNDFGDPASGFNPNRVRYSVTRDGLIGEKNAYDVVMSRSVLEHVNCLDKTIGDMAATLRPDGIAIHKVDLKSHNLDRYLPFDFLTWPESIYQLMHSHKGRPNRWRVDKYKEVVGRSGLRFRTLVDTGRLEADKIERIRPKLAATFRDVPTDELSWLGFWMVLERA